MFVQGFDARGGIGGVADNTEYKVAAAACVPDVEVARFQADSQGGLQHGMALLERINGLGSVQRSEHGIRRTAMLGLSEVQAHMIASARNSVTLT